MEIEIGRGKKGRRAYGLDEIAIVPSRRTRDPEDVDLTWRLDGHSVRAARCSPRRWTAWSTRGRRASSASIGGLGVLNLEGIQTRYEEADAELERIAQMPPAEATRGLQEVYQEPIKPELIAQRIKEIKAQGVTVAGSLTPQRVTDYIDIVLDAGLDILVIQGTVVSAEHVSSVAEPLNLKRFIAELPVPVIVGGCASYHAALHLMRTGAVGVLVGVGPGAACTTRQVIGVGVPQATAIADAAGARMQHLLETGQYVNVIADGGMAYAGDLAKAIACGADACMIGSPFAKAAEAPGRGYHWGMATFHPQLPARHPRQDADHRDPRGDPHRPGPRERRHAQPGRRPAQRHGHLRLRLDPELPEVRGDGRAGAQDRGQEAPAGPARGDGVALATAEHAALDPALAAAAPGGVLVVDFGAQYSQLIARRIRECRVFSAVVPHDTPPEEILALHPAGLVLSGGPASVYEPGRPRARPAPARARHPGPGHLLRHAVDGPGPRRRGGPHRCR